ncbi:MAG: hypothetical protein MRY32_04595 [Rickettsiales bacterium]|nr:hypothetical protein [Rickettsiales bacterium]
MEFIHDIPPIAFAIIFVLLLVLTLAYLFMDEKALRAQLEDVIPEHRIDFLLKKFRQRNVLSLLFIALIFSSMGYLLEDLRHQVRHLELRMAAQQRISDSIQQLEMQRRSATSVYRTENQTSEDDPSLILSLLESESDWAHDATLDDLKQRYENSLVGAYILLRCERTNADEVKALMRAMHSDLLEHKKHGTVEKIDVSELYSGIVTAAEGSFQMMYSRTPCDAPELAMLDQQYANFMLRFQAKTP